MDEDFRKEAIKSCYKQNKKLGFLCLKEKLIRRPSKPQNDVKSTNDIEVYSVTQNDMSSTETADSLTCSTERETQFNPEKCCGYCTHNEKTSKINGDINRGVNNEKDTVVTLEHGSEINLKKYREINPKHGGEINLKKDGEDNPEHESDVNYKKVREVNPKLGSDVNLEHESKVHPEHEREVNSENECVANPEHGSKVNPKRENEVNTEHRKKVNPEHKNEVNLENKSKVDPEHDRVVNSENECVVNLEHESDVNLEHESEVNLEHESDVSPKCDRFQKIADAKFRQDSEANIEKDREVELEKANAINVKRVVNHDEKIEANPKKHSEQNLIEPLNEYSFRPIADPDKNPTTVSLCLTTTVAPLVRKYIPAYVGKLYDDLVKQFSIHTQTLPDILPCYNCFKLQYRWINGNNQVKPNRKLNPNPDWDYKVTNDVDLSKLFLPNLKTDYKDFSECDILSILHIIENTGAFPSGVPGNAREVREVRNNAAHYGPNKWSNDMFVESLSSMQNLINSLDIDEKTKRQTVSEIEELKIGKCVLGYGKVMTNVKIRTDENIGDTNSTTNISASAIIKGVSPSEQSRAIDRITKMDYSDDGKGSFDVKRATEGSIKLDLIAGQAIFKSDESFRMAVQKLLHKVITCAGINCNESAYLDVEFVFPKTLTQEQLNIISTALPGALKTEKTERYVLGYGNITTNVKIRTDDNTGVRATIKGVSPTEQSRAIDRITKADASDGEEGSFDIKGAFEGSIKLDLTADETIFKSVESFRMAVEKLLHKVIQSSGINCNESAYLDVEFVFPKTLTQEQLNIISTAFPGALKTDKTENTDEANCDKNSEVNPEKGKDDVNPNQQSVIKPEKNNEVNPGTDNNVTDEKVGKDKSETNSGINPDKLCKVNNLYESNVHPGTDKEVNPAKDNWINPKDSEYNPDLSPNDRLQFNKATEEEENYLRISLLLSGICTRAVRHYFDLEFHPSCLKRKIGCCRNTLIDLKSNRVISQNQWDLLFPITGTPHSTSFDVTLMITLLQTLSSKPVPVVKDTSIDAALGMIKYYRNKLCHIKESRMETSQFGCMWVNLAKAVKVLGGASMYDETIKLRTMVLDSTDKKLMLDLQQSRREIHELRKIIPWNDREILPLKLQAWREVDKMFVVTSQAEKLFKCCKEHLFVTLTGNSVMGKTVTLSHVDLEMAEKGYDVIPVNEPANIMKNYNPNKKTLFVVDDFCRKFVADIFQISKLEKHNEITKYIDNTFVNIIVSCRLQVFQDETFVACKLNRGTSQTQIRDSLNILTNTSITNERNVYTAFHDKIFDFLSFYLGKKMIACLIGNADIKWISERLLLDEYRCGLEPDFTVNVNSQYRLLLVQRLVKEWSNGQINNVFYSINMRKLKFRKYFLSYIQSLDNAQQTRLAQTTDILTEANVLIPCCFYGDIPWINWCFRHGIEINMFNGEGLCAIYGACHDGTDTGVTPLYVACKNDHVEVVQILLDNNAVVNQRTTDHGATPLYAACQNGNMKIVQMLLENNAVVNQRTTDHGATPLYIACQKGHKEIVQMLLENNAVVNQRTTDHGATPLYIACQKGHKEIVQMLLENKAVVNQYITNVGVTPLHVACQHGNTEIVQMCIQNKADINKGTFIGQTPLLLACQQRHIKIVRLLLDNNVDILDCRLVYRPIAKYLLNNLSDGIQVLYRKEERY